MSKKLRLLDVIRVRPDRYRGGKNDELLRLVRARRARGEGRDCPCRHFGSSASDVARGKRRVCASDHLRFSDVEEKWRRASDRWQVCAPPTSGSLLWRFGDALLGEAPPRAPASNGSIDSCFVLHSSISVSFRVSDLDDSVMKFHETTRIVRALDRHSPETSLQPLS